MVLHDFISATRVQADRIIIPTLTTRLPVRLCYDVYCSPTPGVLFTSLFYHRFVLAVDSQRTTALEDAAVSPCASHNREQSNTTDYMPRFAHKHLLEHFKVCVVTMGQ